MRSAAPALLPLLLAAPRAGAQQSDTAAYTAAECPPCAGWNAPQQPFRIHGESWYVGTRGLSAWKGLVRGSVSQVVTQHAACPVLVIK